VIQAGTRLDDRYVLEDVVGRGRLGEVWRAHDTTLGRVLAVKLTRPPLGDEPGFRQRFRAYARAVAELRDPNIVDVYDIGHVGGHTYLVIEFVPGESLHAILRRVGPLAPPEAMKLIAQAARALHVAHGKGIVHGDVKTSNLLVRPDGQLLVSDLGLARIITVTSMAELEELFPTNPVYIPPEQAKGWRPTPLSDIHALGVVAYECLTLTQPFPGGNPLPPDIPEAVREVVMRALARDPGARWPSADAMRAALLRCL